MARADTNVLRLTEGMDRLISGPVRYLAHRPRARATVVAVVGVAAVAGALIPVRDSIGTANIGLALALVVGGAGAYAGLSSGLVTAISAGLAFTFLHAVPHGLPRIEEEQDLLTAALLLIAGALTGWLHDRRMELAERLGGADSEVKRLHRLAEAVIQSETDEQVMAVTCGALQDELALASCRWEPTATTSGLRELRHNAAIQGTQPQTDETALAAVLAAGVTISAREHGQFVLMGGRGSLPTRHQLKVAVVMADLAVAACGLPGNEGGASAVDRSDWSP